MPIHAPSLPPRSSTKGHPAAYVIFRFDLKRALRLRTGRFFAFAFLFILLAQCGWLYGRHLMGAQPSLSALAALADRAVPQGPSFQAQLLTPLMITLLWFQAALVGGGLVARDTLYRIRPLLYAHPVSPLDYLGAKALFAAGLPLAIQLPFILLPWMLSLALAGPAGPVWPTAPLHLVPAALLISALMGAVTLGASSLAGSPRAGFAWALSIFLGSGALARVLASSLGDARWLALSLGSLTTAWPRLLCGASGDGDLGWMPVAAASGAHILLWTWVARQRTRPTQELP